MINNLLSSKCLNFSSHKKYEVLLLFILIFSLSVNAFSAVDVEKINPQNIKKLLKKAKRLQRKGKTKEAEKILRQVIARYPQNAKAKLNLAYILLKRKRLLEAYNYAFDVAESDKENSYAFAILGATMLSAGNFKEARVLLNNSLKLNKKEALAWAGTGMLLFYENKVGDSLKNLREAVFQAPREPDFLFALAQISSRSEKYKEAAEAYEKFLRIATSEDKERKERIKGLIRFLQFLGKKASLYDLGGETQSIVPMKQINNRPVIQVKLKKDGPLLNFVLDTGSGITVVSEKTAKRLKISSVARGGEARALGGDGRFNIVYGFLKRITIGDARVRNVPIYIRKFHRNQDKIDGYIGLSLISKYVTTLDYGNNVFKLIKKKEYKKLNLDKNNGMSVPLRLTSSGFLSGHVKLDGFETPLNFIVDTGASVSVISESLANSHQLKPHLLKQTIDVIGSAGVTEDVPLFLLPNVTFGDYSRKSLKAVALNLNLINEDSGFEQAGILGGNFLKNYSLTFDFEQSKVTFVPNSEK